MMEWLQQEPCLDDVLADPIISAVMVRDGVDHDDLRRMLGKIGGLLHPTSTKEWEEAEAQSLRQTSLRPCPLPPGVRKLCANLAAHPPSDCACPVVLSHTP